MIVGEDDGRGAQANGRCKDLARLEGGDVRATNRHPFTADRLIAGIEVEHGEALLRARPEILEL
jgi:hypothetical protein